MFIRVTYDDYVMHVNVNHIQGFKPNGSYTLIWLSDGSYVRVNENESELLKLIEEARKNGN